MMVLKMLRPPWRPQRLRLLLRLSSNPNPVLSATRTPSQPLSQYKPTSNQTIPPRDSMCQTYPSASGIQTWETCLGWVVLWFDEFFSFCLHLSFSACFTWQNSVHKTIYCLYISVWCVRARARELGQYWSPISEGPISLHTVKTEAISMKSLLLRRVTGRTVLNF